MRASLPVALTALIVLLGAARRAPAEPDRALWGALFGAATGAVVAHNVDDIDSDIAVPLGAVLGGLIGDRSDRAYRDYTYHRTARRHCRPDYARWPTPYLAPPLRHHYRPYHRRRTVRRHVPPRRAPRPTPRHVPPDLQPGVDLVKVSILHSNGIRTDLRILRMQDRFVGPQGETYDHLPTAAELAQKYAM